MFLCNPEFSNIVCAVTYIPPDANMVSACDKLTDFMQIQAEKYPDSARIILGDFNRCAVNGHLPLFHQYVECPTRDNSTLDLFFCNIKNAYKVSTKPPLGNSDHILLHMIPGYRQLLKRSKPVDMQITKWSVDALDELQGCFDSTDWNVLYDPSCSINENVMVITDYINFCVDSIVPVKYVRCFPNNKPWVTKELKNLLNMKKSTDVINNKVKSCELQVRIKRVVCKCKEDYKNKIEKMLSDSKSCQAWKGLKTLSGFKKKCNLPEVDDDSKYANDLNTFYARFDDKDFSDECSPILESVMKLCEFDSLITLNENDVLKVLSNINVKKACGPDKVCGRVLKECRHQLSSILFKLFQLCIDSHVFPASWLSSEIVPIPKNNSVKVPNDLRPVALTSIVIRCFERILLKILEPSKLVDNLQFAYVGGRSVDDASLTMIHLLQSHLDALRHYARVLFIDFSSAFNTIQPHVMIQKLVDKGVNSHLVMLVYSFLPKRPQYVRFKSSYSDPIDVNTGAPQGCVLSALPFTIYTADKCSLSDNVTIIKYADDTVIIGLLDDEQRSLDMYFSEIDSFAKWCNDNFLDLNVKKTKEMIFDFRSKLTPHVPTFINDSEVEVVETYKYLGTVIDDKLKGSYNVNCIYKKLNQRMYFVRKLKKANVSKIVMSKFYKAVVESVVLFSICCWFGSCSMSDKKKIKKVINSARRIGCTVASLENLYSDSVLKKVNDIILDCNHPLFSSFHLLPSGNRLRSISSRTNRFKMSFVLAAIRMFNKSSL